MDNKQELATQKQKLDDFKLSLAEENKKVNELKVSFSKIKEKLSTKGSADMYPTIEELANNVYSSINYLHERIDRSNKMTVECMENQYSHSNLSHLPPLHGSAMKKLLKAAGIDEEYQIAPKTLYTYASIKNNLEVEMLDNSKS